MPMPTELDHCPITPECSAKKLFRDEESGKLYRLDGRNGSFVEHICAARGVVSEVPKYVYLGKFRNNRTGRTRYNGPTRMRVSAEKPPPDGGKKYRDKEESDQEWTLLDTLVSELDWKSVKDFKPEEE